MIIKVNTVNGKPLMISGHQIPEDCDFMTYEKCKEEGMAIGWLLATSLPAETVKWIANELQHAIDGDSPSDGVIETIIKKCEV